MAYNNNGGAFDRNANTNFWATMMSDAAKSAANTWIGLKQNETANKQIQNNYEIANNQIELERKKHQFELDKDQWNKDFAMNIQKGKDMVSASDAELRSTPGKEFYRTLLYADGFDDKGLSRWKTKTYEDFVAKKEYEDAKKVKTAPNQDYVGLQSQISGLAQMISSVINPTATGAAAIGYSPLSDKDKEKANATNPNSGTYNDNQILGWFGNNKDIMNNAAKVYNGYLAYAMNNRGWGATNNNREARNYFNNTYTGEKNNQQWKLAQYYYDIFPSIKSKLIDDQSLKFSNNNRNVRIQYMNDALRGLFTTPNAEDVRAVNALGGLDEEQLKAFALKYSPLYQKLSVGGY